jgi:hypothetical protein
MDVQTIADALDLRRSGSRFRGACPVCGGSHKANKFSLTSAGDKVLWYCHGGCSQESIRLELVDRGLLEQRMEKAPAARYSKAEIEQAELVILVGEAAIRKGDPAADEQRNIRDFMRAALMVRNSKKKSSTALLAAACLKTAHVRAYLAKGLIND